MVDLMKMFTHKLIHQINKIYIKFICKNERKSENSTIEYCYLDKIGKNWDEFNVDIFCISVKTFLSKLYATSDKDT